MSKSLLVIVTGANRGIGRAICENILSRPDSSAIKLFATTRKGDNLGLSSTNSGSEVLYPSLDISSRDSIHAFKDEVKQHGDVNVLINNAGVNLDNQYSPETAKQTLDVNYRGTVEMCKTFKPHLSKTGRIVNLSSVASTLKLYDSSIQDRLRNAARLSELDELAEEYEAAVKAKTEADAGFGQPGRAYSFSKALLRAATAISAREDREANPKSEVLINCCCPGWVSTDMGKLVGRAPKKPEEGARIPVRLAFDDLNGTTGEYWANDSVRSRESGKVQPWV
ncbi:hypothetical protein M409DRAFT_67203 [Zasmidium cellare ATCC 36951]|uniref:NAD(P)-binding protein n=1 Tax=Zasmidium cellare ATCC 36951 TaxID=1080233 RepID=A0A6A6CGN5_ZASCE|nr:uncharacterized protein M409DRAFT_67203 [Zasmidium cellare ATCC 36951]KAF2165338.1 hypothetical protein M409DRAFT_67203 [Zasmidium cellare ATCC 36951]